MEGVKHLIECHCVLPQYRNVTPTVYHKFVVFSIIDDSDTIIPKQAKCNSCGVIHNIIDLCKSEIFNGKEHGAIIDQEDIALMLPESVSNILETYNCDIATWEQALFILQNEKWDSNIVLTKKEDDGEQHGKILKFKGRGQYFIEPYIMRNRI